jgi:hypothetical protein
MVERRLKPVQELVQPPAPYKPTVVAGRAVKQVVLPYVGASTSMQEVKVTMAQTPWEASS